MPFKLSEVGGGSPKPIGSSQWMLTNSQTTITTDSATYLKSGAMSVNEASTYPEAYNNFDQFGRFWTTEGTPNSGALVNEGLPQNAIAFGNGKLLFVTSVGSLFSTTNGTTWTKTTLSIFAGRTVYSLRFLNGLFFACAAGTSGTPVQLASSPDGVTWTAANVGILNTTSIFDITYGNGTYQVVTSQQYGYMYKSTDGVNWTQTVYPSIGATFRTVLFSNGVFVVHTGSGSAVFTSPDGTTWTQRTTGVTGVYLALTNGVFVMGGAEAALATSYDGITWVKRLLSAVTSGQVDSCGYARGLYVISVRGVGVALTKDFESFDIITLINPRPFGGCHMVLGFDALYFLASPDSSAANTRFYPRTFQSGVGISTNITLGDGAVTKYIRIK